MKQNIFFFFSKFNHEIRMTSMPRGKLSRVIVTSQEIELIEASLTTIALQDKQSFHS